MTGGIELQRGIRTDDEGCLAQLAEIANREYQMVCSTAERAVRHAIKCGDELNKAKELLPHGSFGPWLEKNFKGSPRTARDYMRIAANRQRSAIFEASSIAEALGELRCLMGPPGAKAEGIALKTEAEQPDGAGSSPDGKISETPDMFVKPPVPPSANGTEPKRASQASPMTGTERAGRIIKLLNADIRCGPAEAVRQELREVRDFCAKQLSEQSQVAE